MENRKKVVFNQEDILKALLSLIRQDMVAACVQKESCLLLHLINGQEYKITLEELKN